jgi:hypothetical protein
MRPSEPQANSGPAVDVDLGGALFDRDPGRLFDHIVFVGKSRLLDILGAPA